MSLWLVSMNIALQLILLLLIVCILVVINFSKATFNKLTLLPYFFLILYTIFAICQFATSYCLDVGHSRLKNWLIVNKVNFLDIGITFQVYEWLNTWLLIRYQIDYDITNVHIEAKRKYQPVEKCIRNVSYSLMAALFVASNVVIITIDETKLFDARNSICFAQFLLLWVPIFASIVLFPHAASTYFRAEYLDYRRAFLTQAAGTVVVNLCNTVIQYLFWFDPTFIKASPLSTPFLMLLLLQSFGAFIFVLSKHPKDLFQNFNKRPDV